MDPSQRDELLEQICRLGISESILNEYLHFCAEKSTASGGSGRKKDNSAALPNFAGFCRYLNIGVENAWKILRKYPDELSAILATLEDEALNSPASPALLSAYLKKRIGYEKEPEAEGADGLQICFDHDIRRDGE